VPKVDRHGHSRSSRQRPGKRSISARAPSGDRPTRSSFATTIPPLSPASTRATAPVTSGRSIRARTHLVARIADRRPLPYLDDRSISSSRRRGTVAIPATDAPHAHVASRITASSYASRACCASASPAALSGSAMDLATTQWRGCSARPFGKGVGAGIASADLGRRPGVLRLDRNLNTELG